jgi:YbbR domain-containing protein
MIAFLRRIFLKDFWLKLFAFALAVLIWLTVNIAITKESSGGPVLSLTPTEQKTFSGLPVVVLSSAEDVRVVRVNPKEVDVTVQGDPKLFKNLVGRDIRVMLDLTDIPAAHDMRVRVKVTVPADLSVFAVSPEEVQVAFPPKPAADAP